MVSQRLLALLLLGAVALAGATGRGLLQGEVGQPVTVQGERASGMALTEAGARTGPSTASVFGPPGFRTVWPCPHRRHGAGDRGGLPEPPAS